MAGALPAHLTTRLSLRRGGLRMPRDVASVKAVDTLTFAGLEAEA